MKLRRRSEPARHSREPRLSHRWPRRALLLVVWIAVPALLLCVVELGLRAANVGHSTRPFLEKRHDGATLYALNKNYYYQFLRAHGRESYDTPPEVVIPEATNPKCYRIFVLGGSAAYGWPFPEFGIANLLEAMLRTTYPNARFEVHNLAFHAMNSHVMRHLAKASAKLHPDVYVVYLGNNEMAGPLGLTSVLGPRRLPEPILAATIRAHIVLFNTRLVQVLRFQAQEWWSESATAIRWGETAPAYGSDDARLKRIYEHFRHNLDSICQTAQHADAKVILCTVGRNLRDWSPRCSMHSAGLGGAEEQRWETFYQQGRKHENQHDYLKALQSYEEAAFIDDAFAELQFRLGRCYWATHEFSKARDCFVRAGDLDVTFAAADSPINGAITQTAADWLASGVFLADAAQHLAQQSAHGCPGNEAFYDQVHLTFEGNYRIASSIFEQVVAALPDSIRDGREAAPTPPSLHACEALLAFSPGQRLRQTTEAIGIMRNFCQVDHLEALLAKLESDIGANAGQAIADGCRRALQLDAHNAAVRRRYVHALTELGDLDEAVRQGRILVERQPYLWHNQLALARAAQAAGKSEQALGQFRTMLMLYPEAAETHYEWGNLLRGAKRHEDAAAAYHRASCMKPNNVAMKCAAGKLLAESGDFEAACSAYREAIAIDPKNPWPYDQFHLCLTECADTETAIAQWRRAVRDHPDATQPAFFLGRALHEAGNLTSAVDAYHKALEFDGPNAQILRYAAEALTDKADFDAAIQTYIKAIDLLPNDVALHAGLGAALAANGNTDAAIQACQKAIAIDPEDWRAYNELDHLFADQDDLERRIQLWRNTTEQHPQAVRPLFHLGLALRHAEHTDQAIDSFTKALALDDANLEVRSHLACLLAEKGDLEHALEMARQVAARDPSLATMVADAMRDAASRFTAQGDSEKAAAANRAAMALTP